MAIVNLLDTATYKDGYRYNGTNLDGSPKEQAWGNNCLIFANVSSNTKYTILDPKGTKYVKNIYYFNGTNFLNSLYNPYGLSSFTPPTNCTNISIFVACSLATFKASGIRVEYEDTSIIVVPPETVTDSDIIIANLTAENTALKEENANLKAEIDTLTASIKNLDALEIKINNLRRDMNILLGNL